MSAPYIPFYIDDFDGATAHLSASEEGIYMRLIKMAWRTPRCELPNDLPLIARRCRVTVEEVEPILREFFRLSRGRWSQARLKREYDKLADKKRERSEAGRKGGLNSALKNKENVSSKAVRLLKQPEPEPEPDRNITPAEPAAFETCWKSFPHVKTRMSKNKALTEFRKLPHAEQSLLSQAIQAFDETLRDRDREFVPAMERWLRDGKHRAFLPADSPAVDRTDLIRAYRHSGTWPSEWGERPTAEELAA